MQEIDSVSDAVHPSIVARELQARRVDVDGNDSLACESELDGIATDAGECVDDQIALTPFRHVLCQHLGCHLRADGRDSSGVTKLHVRVAALAARAQHASNGKGHREPALTVELHASVELAK